MMTMNENPEPFNGDDLGVRNRGQNPKMSLRNAMLLFYLFTFSVLLWHRLGAMGIDTTDAERAHDTEVAARIAVSIAVALVLLCVSLALDRRKRKKLSTVAEPAN